MVLINRKIKNISEGIIFTANAIKTYQNFPLAMQHHFMPNRVIKKKIDIFNLRNGLKLALRASEKNDFESLHDIISSKIYWPDRRFEVKDDFTVIDIGAQIGIFSTSAAKVAKNVQVYSYEPMKENYLMLKKNIELNKVDNIHAFNLGVFSKKCKIKLFLADGSGRHSIINKSKNFEEITCVSLKKAFDDNKIKRCNLLKIDVEGSEYDILFKTPEKYLNRINRIVMEVHPHPKYFCKDLISFFKKINFDAEFSEKNSILYLINRGVQNN